MAWCLDTIDALAEPLHPEESTGIEQMAPVRLREYIAGRTAARRAIRQLTGAITPVPRNADRSPRWPAGLCGSLSHTRSYAIGVVANTEYFDAVGVDIEEDFRVGQDLWSQLFTPAELSFLRPMPLSRAEQTASLLFSAKEAYYKCLPQFFQKQDEAFAFNRIQTCVDFSAARIDCAALPRGNLPKLRGHFASFDRHWITIFHRSVPTGVMRRSDPKNLASADITLAIKQKASWPAVLLTTK
jgi:4'-phosphopantetheinyl transferase EntD